MKAERKCRGNKSEEVIRRGPWTLEEDTLLIHYVGSHGEGRWNFLAKAAGLKRTGKSCRLRWLNYLKPDIKRGNLTPQEQFLILQLHSKWGNRWSKIAAHLPGRTDNEIKNYWRTRVQKQARQLNMESNSQSFMDAVRSFYMPTLVQNIDQSSDTPSPTKFPDVLTQCPEIPHQPTPTPTPTTVAADMDLSTVSDCHVASHSWLCNDVAEYDIWELDELWQFRNGENHVGI